MLEEMDPEGTGKIGLKAFEKGNRDRFRKFDSDNDGKLSLTEYEDLWSQAMRVKMIRQFQIHDRDGDGAVM